MSHNSIKSRFSISLAANILRGLVTVLTTIFLARLLGADDYGRIAFLLAAFQAIRQLLDPGVSSAFYTFLSQSNRSTRFMAFYGLFILVKYLLMIGVVWLVLPESWLNYVWRGESRDILIFALSAVMMQFEWWPSTLQVLESQRRTALAQGLYLLLLTLQLLGLFLLHSLEILNIKSFLLMSAVLWASATIMLALCYQFRSISHTVHAEDLLLEKYISYCLPLAPLVLLSFLVDFSDRWLLQSFGGSREQGFFSISQQIASVTLLISASLMRVLWKEFAEALHHERVEEARLLYTNVKKKLFFVSVMIAAALGPWANDIVTLIFGQAYVFAAPVFMVLIFAAVFQTLGQIEGTLLMASGNTGTGLKFNILTAPVWIGLSFFLIAGTDGLRLSISPSLGALGLAVKILIVQIVSVNVQGYLLSQKLTWDFEWFYQIKILAVFVPLGFLTKIIFAILVENFIFKMLLATIFYMLTVIILLVCFPRTLEVGFSLDGLIRRYKSGSIFLRN